MKKVVSKLKVIRVFEEDAVSFDNMFESVIDGVVEDAIYNSLVVPHDLEVA